jgi:hypothetical protein
VPERTPVGRRPGSAGALGSIDRHCIRETWHRRLSEPPGVIGVPEGNFKLRDHPDYQRDWSCLDRRSTEAIDDIRTEIQGLPRIARGAERDRINQRLDSFRVCMMVGESGSGKSALAKATAAERYQRVVWLTSDCLNCATPVEFERSLEIDHSILQILSASSAGCLVVFDGVEGWSERAQRLASRIIHELLRGTSFNHVHLLLTIQLEATDRVFTYLSEEGTPRSLLEPTQIHCPSESVIREILATLPELEWMTERSELRPLLTNLKILDWVVRVTRSGTSLDGTRVLSLTSLIDRLWDRWVGGNHRDSSVRSYVLLRLGMLEAETLSTGVPCVEFGHAELETLSDLATADLVRIGDARVRFSHDLLGDWSRMMVLVGQKPTDSIEHRDRAASPRWHRAVRLFGQRLLEQASAGCEDWRWSVEQMEDGSVAGAVIRDLFLESLFLATNAEELLERVWLVLTADRGRLLNKLLDRFLFTATLPDSALAEFAGSAEAFARLEHEFRVPFAPVWGPVLTVLHGHCAEAVQLAALNVSRICCLWLRTTPTDLDSGLPTPWRREAAALAVAAAREVQSWRENGDSRSGKGHRVVYEAALYAASEFPEEVATVCLESSKRRGPSRDAHTRTGRARIEGKGEYPREFKANVKRQSPPQRGQSQESPDGCVQPFPDGPCEKVALGFRAACLDTRAFRTLVCASPDVALEVLLAVCIEQPNRGPGLSPSVRDRYGVVDWPSGWPPMYFCGPFLDFLRDAHQQGVSAVLRLVNHATRRFCGTPHWLDYHGVTGHKRDTGVGLMIGDELRTWAGDDTVFGWHDGGAHSSPIVACALMALEQWLYEGIDRGDDVTPWLNRILVESESVAFAGLLLEVGKRTPELLAGPLLPLLRASELYEFDSAAVVARAGVNQRLPAWDTQPGMLASLARQWYGLEHRCRFLRDLAALTMLRRDDLRPFFENIRADWAARVSGDKRLSGLRLLIERLNTANYRVVKHGGGRIDYSFEWPESVSQRTADALERSRERISILNLPTDYRRRLDAKNPIPPDQRFAFLSELRAIRDQTAAPAEFGHGSADSESALCGGIAVLVVLHRDWLAADRSLKDWCRQAIQAVLDHSPAWTALDHPESRGRNRWDTFIAECAVALLAEDRDDPLARSLVSRSLAAYRYETVALTMERAFQRRDHLREVFDVMLNLGLRLTGLRSVIERADRLQLNNEHGRWLKEQNKLIKRFCDRKLSSAVPSLAEIDRTASASLRGLRGQRFPNNAEGHKRHRGPIPLDSPGPISPAVDRSMVQAVLGWLDLGTVHSEDERRSRLQMVREVLGLSLASVAKVGQPRQPQDDGRPNDFDNWTYALVAKTIPQLIQLEDPGSLWRPVIELGAPGHLRVVEYLSHWFREGAGSAATTDDFTAIWQSMISHAMSLPLWQPVNCVASDLAEMVCALLGFTFDPIAALADSKYTDAVGNMVDTFKLAAEQWFALLPVASGFAAFAVRPLAARLFLPGVSWLWVATRSFSDQEWNNSELEEHLVVFLRVCWDRESARVSGDPQIRRPFLDLLNQLCARGGHAAAALRDRVLDSIGR